MMQPICVPLLALTLLISACAASSGTGYPSVAAAMQDLRARQDISIYVQQGWTIATDRTNYTIWSFPPQDHAAYPSAVKRQVIQRAGSIYVDTRVLCEAPQSACDALTADFRQLTETMRQELNKPR